MRLQEDEHLQEMYRSFHNIPGSPALARWVFEAIVHRMLSDGWRSGPTPQPIRMVSNSRVPPVFLTDPSSSTLDTSLSPLVPLHACTRAVTRANFTGRQLSDVTLNNGKYYISTAADHPL